MNATVLACIPEMTPLSRPGMPWIWVTLFSMKYSSQVDSMEAFVQKMFHSSVCLDTLFSTITF